MEGADLSCLFFKKSVKSLFRLIHRDFLSLNNLRYKNLKKSRATFLLCPGLGATCSTQTFYDVVLHMVFDLVLLLQL